MLEQIRRLSFKGGDKAASLDLRDCPQWVEFVEGGRIYLRCCDRIPGFTFPIREGQHPPDRRAVCRQAIRSRSCNVSPEPKPFQRLSMDATQPSSDFAQAESHRRQNCLAKVFEPITISLFLFPFARELDSAGRLTAPGDLNAARHFYPSRVNQYRKSLFDLPRPLTDPGSKKLPAYGQPGL